MSTPAKAATSVEIAILDRLFSMLDEYTQREILIAMDELAVEMEHEAAEGRFRRNRITAIYAWTQSIRRNTACWAPVGNLAFLESYERLPLRLHANAVPIEKKTSKHHSRHTREV